MITKEMILNRVSQEDIMIKYFPEPVIINKFITNPFRNDNKADCKFFYSQNTLLFIDFAFKKYSGDCFKIASISQNVEFPYVLKLIDKDFNLNLAPTGFKQRSKKIIYDIPKVDSPKKELTKIFYDKMNFTKRDLEFWSSYYIKKSTLELFNVCSAYRVWIGTNGEIFTYHPKNPIYVYNIKDNRYVEIYRPFANRIEKFRNNIKPHICQGYNQLPNTGDILIISKAYKDVMCLYELGYNAVSFGGEGKLIQEDLMNEFKKRFEQVIVFFDNDEAGIQNSKLLSDKYNIKNICIDIKMKIKDISDYVKTNGKENTINFLNTKLG